MVLQDAAEVGRAAGEGLRLEPEQPGAGEGPGGDGLAQPGHDVAVGDLVVAVGVGVRISSRFW